MTTYDAYPGNSLNSIIAGLVAGDTLTIHGTHDAAPTVVGVSGTSGSPITIRGDGTAVLRTPDGRTGLQYALEINGDYLHVIDLVCEEAAKGVVIDSANHSKVERVTARFVKDEGFKVRNFSSYVYLQSCAAHDTGLGVSFGEGFYVGDASSNWPDTSTPDTCNHIRLDDCYAYRNYGDGFDCKEGANLIVLKNCTSDHSQGNAPPQGNSTGDSCFYSRADSIAWVNCHGFSAPGYGFKAYDVAVGASTYGRGQKVKAGASTGHGLAGLGSQSDDMVFYSDFVTDGTRYDQVGGGWAATGAEVAPSNFVESTWTSPAAAYTLVDNSADQPVLPTFGAAGTLLATTSSSGAPPFPAGVAAGQVLISEIYSYAGSAVATPAGWTLLGNRALAGGGRMQLFGRPYQAGDTAPTYTGGGTTGLYGVCSSWNGVDTSNPWDASLVSYDETSRVPSSLPIVTATNNALAVAFYSLRDDWTVSTPTNGATLAYASASATGNDAALACAYRPIARAGDSGGIGVATSGAQTNRPWASMTVALRPSPLPTSAPPPPRLRRLRHLLVR